MLMTAYCTCNMNLSFLFNWFVRLVLCHVWLCLCDSTLEQTLLYVDLFTRTKPHLNICVFNSSKSLFNIFLIITLIVKTVADLNILLINSASKLDIRLQHDALYQVNTLDSRCRSPLMWRQKVVNDMTNDRRQQMLKLHFLGKRVRFGTRFNSRIWHWWKLSRQTFCL